MTTVFNYMYLSIHTLHPRYNNTIILIYVTVHGKKGARAIITQRLNFMHYKTHSSSSWKIVYACCKRHQKPLHRALNGCHTRPWPPKSDNRSCFSEPFESTTMVSCRLCHYFTAVMALRIRFSGHKVCQLILLQCEASSWSRHENKTMFMHLQVSHGCYRKHVQHLTSPHCHAPCS